MLGGIEHWVPVVAVSLAALPLAVLAATALLRGRRRRGVPHGLARRQAVADVGMVAGTIPWVWMILTPLPAPRDLHIVPFVDVVDLVNGSPMTAFFQIAGNILVFAAFGFFAPIRWRLGVVAVLAIAAAASIVVEVLQYALALGRVSSIDDVLLNAAGAGLTATASRRFWASRTATSAPEAKPPDPTQRYPALEMRPPGPP